MLAAFLIVILIFAAVLFLIIKCIKNKRFPIVTKAYEFIKKKVFWNFFLRYSLEVYLETILAYTIKLKALKFGDLSQSVSSILAVSIYVIMIGYIFFVMGFL